jgi:putative SOS response-associated peptidase YedK
MFETWSFRDSARLKRCLICIDGFFEYYHYKGKTYPYYIHNSDGTPMKLAGLWSEWQDKETGEKLRTFSIVTTRGNELLSKIHNNPKLDGPRMPLILPENAIDEWLIADVKNEADKQHILNLVKPFTEKELTAHTVQRLTGKNAIKNNPRATEPFAYDELKIDPLKQANLLF